MIIDQTPLSMAEAKEYLSGADDGQKELLGFIKRELPTLMCGKNDR